MKANTTCLFTTIVYLIQKLSILVFLSSCLIRPSLSKEITKVEINKILVDDDKVTIRLKVTDESVRPVSDLSADNFRLLVDGEPVSFSFQDWKSPQEAEPPPAWIIILLDLSGSMAQLDSQGITKLQGAISAIREFIQVAAERGGDTKISIVPFGEGGRYCPGFNVNNKTYDPLSKAVRFLGNTSDSRFFPPENSGQTQPRLAIILLSDGYDNRVDEELEFNKLVQLLSSYPDITVHTVGYGLTPAELGEKYGLDRPAKREDIGEGLGEIPGEEFVYTERLTQIANSTEGISMLSPSSSEIASALNLFFQALLGEYEITYLQYLSCLLVVVYHFGTGQKV